jgi:hypothetical protein
MRARMNRLRDVIQAASVWIASSASLFAMGTPSVRDGMDADNEIFSGTPN